MTNQNHDQAQQQTQEPAQKSIKAQGEEQAELVGTATYSPDDNKLRLYAFARLDADVYARLKTAGFKWAPRQELFVAPMWTPQRADLLAELCGEVGDEDTSLVERAQERAERFADYSEKRAKDAETARAGVEQVAKRFEFGQPILVGHHSERKARKDAERITSGMRFAVKMWETSTYWRARAQGAKQHAKYKELPAVRARRIKKIEADKRARERSIASAEKYLVQWQQKGLTMEQATIIAGCDSLHLRNRDGGFGSSLWSLLECGEKTAPEAAAIAIAHHTRRIGWCKRWLEHFELRLLYERAMLADVGGTPADRTAPEKGGAVKCWVTQRGGWAYIKKVNKVSVTLEDNWGNGGRTFTRTIPFDKLQALMTADQVRASRESGQLVENTHKTGFFLVAPTEPTPAKETTDKATSNDSNGATQQTAAFDALRAQLKHGIEVVSAPQLFPTPPALASQMVALLQIEPGHAVLEPSAGTGRLIDAVLAVDAAARITAVELDPRLAARLQQARPANVTVHAGDFLVLAPALGQFNRILMNPPFAKAVDIAHIECAFGLLRPGGVLVALCANGPRQQARLQPLVERSGGQWQALPEGAFQSEGTGVRVALLTLQRAG